MKVGHLSQSLIRRVRELWLRIALMGGIQLANMVLAYFLLPAEYGVVAMAAFVLKNCHQGMLGLTQGYIYAHYNDENDHLRSYALAFITLGLGYFGAAWILLETPLVLAGLPFIALFLIEPYLRVKRNFAAIFVPEFIFLASVIVIIPIVRADDVAGATPLLALLSLLFSALYILSMRRGGLSGFATALRQSELSLGGMYELMRNGSQAYFSTLLAFIVLLIDRKYILSLYGEEALGVFMLAFQACLVITLVSSLFNATSMVDVGTLIREEPSRVIRHLRARFFLMLLANFFLWVAVVFFLFVFSGDLFPEFNGLVLVSSMVGFGMMLQGSFYSVSSFLFFRGRQHVANAIMAFVIAFKFCAYLVLEVGGGDFLCAIFAQSLILTLGMIFSIAYLWVCAIGVLRNPTGSAALQGK